MELLLVMGTMLAASGIILLIRRHAYYWTFGQTSPSSKDEIEYTQGNEQQEDTQASELKS